MLSKIVKNKSILVWFCECTNITFSPYLQLTLTTALIFLRNKPSFYKFKEMAIMASKAFCTHLIFCNISISFQTNSCWHKKWLCAIDCQMPAQISEYSGKNLPICHKPTLNCCSKSSLNWLERYYLHFPAYIWQNCS